MVTAAEIRQMTAALGETMTASVAAIGATIGTRLDAMDADIYANRSAINDGVADRTALRVEVADLRTQVNAQRVTRARFMAIAAAVALVASAAGFAVGWVVFG